MDTISHFLLTKFNLPISYARRTGQHGEEAWLTSRWSLFERYCLPSVLNQSGTDFVWVLYCWDQTPEPFRSRLERLADRHDHVHVHFLTTTTRGEHLCEWARAKGLPLRPLLLTTRLDNDDALSADYMARIRKAARGFVRSRDSLLEPHVWSAPLGYQTSAGKYYLRLDPQGPFVSLLENVAEGEPRTVLSLSHRDITSSYSSSYVAGKPMWLQVVHDDNLVNSVDGIRVPYSPERRFGLSPPEVRAHESILDVGRDVARSLIDYTTSLARSVVRRTTSRVSAP
jgi:hypothetical protein